VFSILRLWQIVEVNSSKPGPVTSLPAASASSSVFSPGGWPKPSPATAFEARRRLLQGRLTRPAVFASGWARSRNFPSNCYPFRAESHFLYLLGRQLEGAALVIGAEGSRLYVPAPDPGARLWHGAEPGVEQLSRELGLEVCLLEELEPLAQAATLPPQDPRAAAWLSERLGRPIVAGGSVVHASDAELAESMIALRLVHDDAAIAQMRQAAAVTAQAHLAGMRHTRVGRREAEVCAVMQASIASAGMALAYQPIVTVHGEVLHALHQTEVMGQADLLLVDVGAETPEGWAADVTRTWPVSGRFSATQRALYDAVLTARAAALASVRPGARFSDVHQASQRALLECLMDLKILRGSLESLLACHAVALFYPHGVGHLLGLDVHDMEDLGDRAGYAVGRQRVLDPSRRFLRLDRDLQAGMVVTIEPGFYQIPDLLEGIDPGGPLGRALDRDRLAVFEDVRGIRVEDDVLVTLQGYELLSAALPQEAPAIEGLMAG
jgi:Xaa-Pro aminopeptidase